MARSRRNRTRGPDGPVAAPLGELDRRLGDARLRWFASHLTTGLLWTLAVAAVAVVGVLVAVPADAPRLLRPVGYGVLIAGLLLSLVRAWRVTPSTQQAARIAERAYDMKTQLSTARELGAPLPTPAQRLLRDALLADARRLSTRLDPRRLAPFRFGRTHLAATVITVAAVAGAGWLATRPVPVVPQEARQVSPDTPPDPAVREALAVELDRLAAAVAVEADRAADAYAGALAEAARELARNLRSDDPAALATSAQIESLLGHVGEALGPRFAVEPRPAERGEAPVDLAPLSTPSAPGDAAAAAERASSDGDDLLDRVEALRERLEDVQGMRVDNPYGDAFDPARLVDAAREGAAAQVAEGEGAGAPAGAAERSSDAPGDAAGGGAAGLDGAPQEGAAFEGIEEVALPEAAVPGQGARVGAAGDPSEAAGAEAGAVAQRPGGGASDAPLAVAAPPPESVRDEAGGWRGHDLSPAARRLASRLLAPPPEEAP